jgi:MtN3 and saliva related transmembrane protein
MSNSFIETVGIAAGVCTSLALLPQLIKLMKYKKAEDLSLVYLVTLFCGLVLWIWYGVLRDDLPIMLTNVVSLVLNILMIIMGVKYKKNITIG